MKRRENWGSDQRNLWKQEQRCDECGVTTRRTKEEMNLEKTWRAINICPDCFDSEECYGKVCPVCTRCCIGRELELKRCENCGLKGCGDPINGLYCHTFCYICSEIWFCNAENNPECAKNNVTSCECFFILCKNCFSVKKNHENLCFWASKKRFQSILCGTYLEVVAQDIYPFCMERCEFFIDFIVFI